MKDNWKGNREERTQEEIKEVMIQKGRKESTKDGKKKGRRNTGRKSEK